MTLLWPLDSNAVAAGGGYMADRGAGHVPRYHQGVDVPVGVGTPIYGSGDGTVATVANTGPTAGYGLYVQVQYGALKVITAHMSSTDVTVGQAVTSSTVLGKSGGTKGAFGAGDATGPHCHVETHLNGTLVDPHSQLSPRNGAAGGGGGLMRITVPGVTVADAQNRLIAWGISVGATGADNVNGPATTAGLTAFQTAEKLTVDDILGPDTWAKLQSTPTVAAPPFPLAAGQYFGPEGGPAASVSGYHSHAADLAVWQTQATAAGYNPGPTGADGRYGPVGAKDPKGYTAAAAKALQAKFGKTQDSLIGPDTWPLPWM